MKKDDLDTAVAKAIEATEVKPEKKGETEEERETREAKIREDAAEAERQRQKDIDEGVVSSKSKKKADTMSDFDKKRDDIRRRAGISPARLKEVIERRKSIPGAELADPDA